MVSAAAAGLYTRPPPLRPRIRRQPGNHRKETGTLKRRTADVDNYYVDGVVWTVAFEGDALEFLQLGVPSNGKRKHGLCP